jgi:ABC-2 type transport system ATP-binding protein
MGHEIISIQQLGYAINGRVILRDIAASIPTGAFVGVLGENGAGKTTLLDLLMGFRVPSQGMIAVLDEQPHRDHWEARRRIAYLSEKVDMPGDWSIQEFLEFHQFFYPQYSHERQQYLLNEFRIAPQDRVGNLSAGEIRRAQIVAALASFPDIVVVDEISAVLDIVGRRKFMRLLHEQSQISQATIVFATNILEDLVNHISHILLLRQGTLHTFTTLEDFTQGHAESEFPQLVADMLEEV